MQRNDRKDDSDLPSMIDPQKTAEILKSAETGSMGRIAKERSEYYLRLTSEAKLGNKGQFLLLAFKLVVRAY